MDMLFLARMFWSCVRTSGASPSDLAYVRTVRPPDQFSSIAHNLVSFFMTRPPPLGPWVTTAGTASSPSLLLMSPSLLLMCSPKLGIADTVLNQIRISFEEKGLRSEGSFGLPSGVVGLLFWRALLR